MVARQGMTVAGVGLVLGLIAAAAGAQVLESFLFGVSARDPLTYAAGALFLGAVARAACWIPARRSGRADPMQALRME
jgi:putative ABC transport system permease protein